MRVYGFSHSISILNTIKEGFEICSGLFKEEEEEEELNRVLSFLQNWKMCKLYMYERRQELHVKTELSAWTFPFLEHSGLKYVFCCLGSQKLRSEGQSCGHNQAPRRQQENACRIINWVLGIGRIIAAWYTLTLDHLLAWNI